MKAESLEQLTEAHNQLEKSKSRWSDVQSHLWETKQYYMLRKLISAYVIQLEVQKNILIQITAIEPISAAELSFLKENND